MSCIIIILSVLSSADFPFPLIVLHFDYFLRFSCVNVDITNDNTVGKEIKVFQLFLLRTPDLDERITILNSPPGMLFIQDDDGIVRLFKMITFFIFFTDVFIGFSSSTYIATESEEQVTVCAQVLNSESGGALRPFSVSILPEKGIFITIYTHSSFYLQFLFLHI